MHLFTSNTHSHRDTHPHNTNMAVHAHTHTHTHTHTHEREKQEARSVLQEGQVYQRLSCHSRLPTPRTWEKTAPDHKASPGGPIIKFNQLSRQFLWRRLLFSALKFGSSHVPADRTGAQVVVSLVGSWRPRRLPDSCPQVSGQHLF